MIRLNNNPLDVSTSKSHKKRYYCSYCMKMVTNFGRHLMTCHVRRKEVEEISKLPKGRDFFIFPELSRSAWNYLHLYYNIFVWF